MVNIFPISEKLRYTIPFMPPEATIDYLAGLADENGRRLATFADDGEKFGVWPKTYEQCYEQGWLEAFFRLLQQHSDWIRLVTFSEALQPLAGGPCLSAHRVLSRMMEWPATKSLMRYEDFTLAERAGHGEGL